MSSSGLGSSSTPLDINAVIASVGQAASADQAERDDSQHAPTADDGGFEQPEDDEPAPAPVPPPTSSTISQPEPEAPAEPAPSQAGSVAEFLGMDSAAIDRLTAALSASPAGGPGVQPAAPPSPPAAPAHPVQPAAQTQQIDLRFVTDEEIDAQADVLGDEATAVLKQMAASQRAMHAHYEQQMGEARGVVEHYRAQEAKQIESTVGGFFGGMKDLGLEQKYGSGPVPVTPEQAQARMALGETADRVWKAMGGKPDTLEQALKTAVYLTDRQAVEESIASRARTGVRQSLQKRKGMLDITPGGSGGHQTPTPSDPDKAGAALASQFVAAQRG